MGTFDIATTALPNCAANEIRFEEPRDVQNILLTFKDEVPENLRFSYLRNKWPDIRLEQLPDTESPCYFGWVASDDWFNGLWQEAQIISSKVHSHKLAIKFKGLKEEFSSLQEYNVPFRRSLAFRFQADSQFEVVEKQVFTTSPGTESTIRIQLKENFESLENQIRFEEYNCLITKITPLSGCSVEKEALALSPWDKISFELTLSHMKPSHKYANDEGLLTFDFGDDKFTISLESLRNEGIIWFEEKWIEIFSSSAPLEEIKTAEEGSILDRVKDRAEQSFQGAFLGQPYPHAVNYNVGCKHNRQRFWLEANSDVVVMKGNVTCVPGKDTERFKNKGNARFFFGLEQWTTQCLYPDPAPVCAYNYGFKKDGIVLRIKAVALPLQGSLENLAGDATIVALMRFQFTNEGLEESTAQLGVRYSQESERSGPSMLPRHEDPLDALTFENQRISSDFEDESYLRALVETSMSGAIEDNKIVFLQSLAANESCSLLLKIPFIALGSDSEVSLLEHLQFQDSYKAIRSFWAEQGRLGAQLRTPEVRLNDLHRSHAMHVGITDFAMPDDDELINTSVGTSTYGNFSNESCMIIQELDQRGAHEEARRRLEVWLRFQGTATQPGNFTDYDGMFFGAGGFEEGAYNQHHGWVLWCLCEHLFLSGDTEWFKERAGKIIAGADWVFRQRRNTMKALPHSRGWEYGFLPAGSLEDVTDFHYWLSTNSLTWRGTEWTARALEKIGHPEAERIRKEADAYRDDLKRGFDTMRQHSPLVRLRDGRWVPQFPSRLYRRGRDIGWIRQTLEGAVYLLISGLYDCESQEANWILNDYQDNLYSQPPYGYYIQDFERNWFNQAGFSIQPNLLAGLMPHLDRDEPEVYIWMFYNAWCSCYREQINALIEHPAPVLGYSNAAHFKTSDEANAVMWLRYMLIYAREDGLYFGRAIPRAWFAQKQPFGLQNVKHHFGESSIEYTPGENTFQAIVTLNLRELPGKSLVRFRLPEGKRLRSVRVDGQEWTLFNQSEGDVDISDLVKTDIPLQRIVIEAKA